MTPEQEKTLESRQGKVTFGMVYERDEPDQYCEDLWHDTTIDLWYWEDEAAYWLMVGRGLEALEKKLNYTWAEVLDMLVMDYMQMKKYPDILAAILAALGVE